MVKRCTLLFAMALVVGCSSESANPKTFPATGKVTLNGSPLEGATVNFYPMEGKGSSIGTTDAEGNYSLTTFRSNDGALPGQYKVTITKYTSPPKAASAPETGSLASGELDVATYAPPSDNPVATATNTGPENLVPAKYANADSSGLRGMVDASNGVNNFDLK
jgi:hypothetical protein